MNLYSSKTYIEDLRTAISNSVGIEELKGKSFLITGATGTIGSFLVDTLLEYSRLGNEVKVYAAGRSIERLRARFGTMESEALEYVSYDINKNIEFDMNVDYIIHAGGNAHPAAFNGDPVGTIIGNIYGTYQLLEYGKKHNTKRLCFISTGEVYGQGDLSLDSFRENYQGYVNPVSARSSYPNSKRTTETLCAAYSAQYGLETVMVRPCHTYGPGITDSDSRANAQFIRNALAGEDIVMKSAGTQMRSYCYVADCVSIILTALVKGKSGQAYNSANSDARISIAGIASVIAGCVGRKVVFENPSEVDIANRTPIAKQVLNTEKIEELGWHGAFTVEKGIAHTIAILKGE